MKLIVQRVENASVIIDRKLYSSINNGILCYVGFANYDVDNNLHLEWYVNKLINLKIFQNSKSLKEVNGDILIVSQFTLFARVKKGNKPSWSHAAKYDVAKKFYDQFVDLVCLKYDKSFVKTGVFGVDMQIKSINDGPMTIILDF